MELNKAIAYVQTNYYWKRWCALYSQVVFLHLIENGMKQSKGLCIELHRAKNSPKQAESLFFHPLTL